MKYTYTPRYINQEAKSLEMTVKDNLGFNVCVVP